MLIHNTYATRYILSRGAHRLKLDPILHLVSEPVGAQNRKSLRNMVSAVISPSLRPKFWLGAQFTNQPAPQNLWGLFLKWKWCTARGRDTDAEQSPAPASFKRKNLF
jgi:hypothetical protein